MKTFLAAVLIATPALAQVSPNVTEALTEARATDKAVAVLVEQAKQLKTELATARQENIDQNAAFKGEIEEREKTIKSQKKTLNSIWVRFILAVRTWFYVILGGFGFYVLLAIATGIYGAPGTATAKIASALIRFPFGWIRRIIDVYNPTMRVGAEQVPVVKPPVVVAPNPDNAPFAQNLAAMQTASGTAVVNTPDPATVVVPAPQPPQQSTIGQAFYGSRSVGEILRGVGRQ